jgi:hypothetical protein
MGMMIAAIAAVRARPFARDSEDAKGLERAVTVVAVGLVPRQTGVWRRRIFARRSHIAEGCSPRYERARDWPSVVCRGDGTADDADEARSQDA